MASIHVVRGVNQGADLSLDVKQPMIMGRNPECAIVIPITSVSREHAQILPMNGQFFIEDLGSRNGTFVNNQAIEGRTLLHNNDRIRICDFVATFLDPNAEAATLEDQSEESPSSTVEATMSHNSSLLLQAQPAEKLRLLLEISSSLSKTLELQPLMPKIVDSLFSLFRQADRCFIIQAEQNEEGNFHLMPSVVKTRREHDEITARFSRGIVRQCLKTAEAILSDDASQDKGLQLNQSVIDFKIRSVMCVPLCNAAGKAFGVIQLDTQDRGKKFTTDDLDLLFGVANQASIAMENARLLHDTVHQERLNRDLELAHRVQLAFLPQSLPVVDNYAFHAYYQAALQVGGDYYDFIRISDDRLVMVLGDVAGKGVSAALLAAKLSSDVRSCFLTQSDPAKALCELNNVLEPQCSKLDKFVTLAAAVLNPLTHEVVLVSGGHMSPLLYRQSSGSLEECVSRKVTGLPIGVMKDYEFESCSVTLEAGDSILIFSDGVTEAQNVREEEFGNAGIHKALKDAGTGDPKVQISKLARAVQLHAAGRAQQHDDITLCGLGRIG